MEVGVCALISQGRSDVGDVGSIVEGGHRKQRRSGGGTESTFLEARVCGEDYDGIQAAANGRPALCDILYELGELVVN